MLVFVCASNLTVPKVLSVIADNPTEEYRILTPIKQIKQFFDRVLSPDKIVLFDLPEQSLADYATFSKAFSKYSFLKRSIEVCKTAVLNKIALKEKFKLYFELYYFADFEFWLVKHLSKKSEEIFYMKSINVEPERVGNLASRIYSFLNSKFYGTSITPIISSGLMTGMISDKYLNDIGAKTINVKIGESTSELIFNKFPELANKKVILLAGGVVKSKAVSETVYTEMAKQIGEKMEEVFSKNDIVVKSHPVYVEYYAKENQYSKIDPIIPLNVILDKNTKLVIGFSSAALYEASLKEGVTVVSTVELFKGKIKEDVFDENKNYLLKNMNAADPILFPKDLDEFSKILRSISI